MIIVYFEYMKTHYCEEVARFTSYEILIIETTQGGVVLVKIINLKEG